MILQSIALAILGLVAGVASGVVGIGGGIILVPALAFLFGLSQHQAQGTTLALPVPPIGILAAWAYWRQGFVDVRIAGLICAGFILGSLLGAKLSIGLSDQTFQRVIGITLLLISIKMIFAKGTW
ncbi:MAG: TSUP family transporter [Bryobacteraceae bacterium]